MVLNEEALSLEANLDARRGMIKGKLIQGYEESKGADSSGRPRCCTNIQNER
jgi:hypothetical protein